MYYVHDDHPGRRVALGYCLNVLAGEELAAIERSLEQTCAAVRERVAPDGVLGIGLYLPAKVAFALAEDGAAKRRQQLARRIRSLGLAAFTANAFPFGGFHRAGLKQHVFEPTWDERERALFTAAVAVVANDLAPDDAKHVSISTHSGLHRSQLPTDAAAARERVLACGRGMGLALGALDLLSQRTGRDTVLSIEPEPRSLMGDTRDLEQHWDTLAEGALLELSERGVGDAAQVVARHLGVCLDTCHAAVEFEDTADVLERIAPRRLGKVQLASALRLPAPSQDTTGRERLLALDEPVYLHQVTGRAPDGSLLRAGDLDELKERPPDWDACDEWRCHFHVPVDAPQPLPEAGGLSTTANDSADLVGALLDAPERWGTDDLHLEVETYTFDVLPPAWREGGLAAGLARELEWARALLESRGWCPV